MGEKGTGRVCCWRGMAWMVTWHGMDGDVAWHGWWRGRENLYREESAKNKVRGCGTCITSNFHVMYFIFVFILRGGFSIVVVLRKKKNTIFIFLIINIFVWVNEGMVSNHCFPPSPPLLSPHLHSPIFFSVVQNLRMDVLNGIAWDRVGKRIFGKLLLSNMVGTLW